MAVDYREDETEGALKLHFARMKERVRFFVRRLVIGGELEDLDALERPSVRLGDTTQLRRAFGERDVERAFSPGPPLEQEMERDRRLARAGLSVDQIEMVRRQPPMEDRIQTGNAGENPRRFLYGGVAGRLAGL